MSTSLMFVLLTSLDAGASAKVAQDTAVSSATTIFTRTQTIGNSASFGVALGDLDGDGDLDAFTANVLFEMAPTNSNKVWFNNGSGQFTDSGQSLGSEDSYAVALGDLDGDDDLDAFVANEGANTVWLNDGEGNFSNSGQSLGMNASRAVLLGDVNQDGSLDAYIANVGAPNILWLNDGNGLFSQSPQALGNQDSYSASFGDLDGDCDLDLFATNYNPTLANEVWLNDGTGQFSDSGQRLGNAPSYTPVLGDFDRDGDLDAYIANANSDELWLNNGDATFQLSSQSQDTDSGFGAATADFDADGDLDIFLPIYSGENGIHLLLNDGTGQFTERLNILETDAANFFVALGDLNGNGRPDAFVTSIFHADGNGIWLNQLSTTQTVSAAHSSPTYLGVPIVFTATASSDPTATYLWDFGDGSSGEGAVVQHTYQRCGEFTAVLTITHNEQVEIAKTAVTIIKSHHLFLPLSMK
ncbi:MAG: FG-GAP-like repeat-containing protein [Chloroflexota bacterium]